MNFIFQRNLYQIDRGSFFYFYLLQVLWVIGELLFFPFHISGGLHLGR